MATSGLNRTSMAAKADISAAEEADFGVHDPALGSNENLSPLLLVNTMKDEPREKVGDMFLTHLVT